MLGKCLPSLPQLIGPGHISSAGPLQGTKLMLMQRMGEPLLTDPWQKLPPEQAKLLVHADILTASSVPVGLECMLANSVLLHEGRPTGAPPARQPLQQSTLGPRGWI